MYSYILLLSIYIIYILILQIEREGMGLQSLITQSLTKQAI